MRPISNTGFERLASIAAERDTAGSRYSLHEVLGEGGMGTVYRGTDELLDRDVAVKVARVRAGPGGAPLVQRLRSEARVLARLEHPGIVPVHDAGILDDGRVFYVMKRVRGATLDRALETMPDRDGRLGILERVAQAVAFAHDHGVVHRDLKPANIMVGGFGEVLVMDWGAARILDRIEPVAGKESDVTDTGTADSAVVGTRGFMAPEQARGKAADQRADVYALGALLVFMIDGTTPSGASPFDRRSWPRRLAAIARKCLDQDPAARYPDAGHVADEIARFRSGAAVAAYSETAVERLGRWISTYRTPILLVVAYLIMRVAIALWSR